MQGKRKILTQKELVTKELQDISVNVTAEDRATYMRVKKASKSKLSLYLNGKVYDTDVALGMVKFFRQRIQKRQEALSQK